MHRPIKNIGLILTMAIVLHGGALRPAQAKSPGMKNCYRGVCYKVMTLREANKAVGTVFETLASYYDDPALDPHNPGNLTSSGARFDWTRTDTVASPIFPDGTELIVWDEKTRHAAHVRVTDNGPFKGKKTLDCTAALADRFGFKRKGSARLQTIVIKVPNRREAKYKANRIYPEVGGYLGRFSSLPAVLHFIKPDRKKGGLLLKTQGQPIKMVRYAINPPRQKMNHAVAGIAALPRRQSGKKVQPRVLRRDAKVRRAARRNAALSKRAKLRRASLVQRNLSAQKMARRKAPQTRVAVEPARPRTRRPRRSCDTFANWPACAFDE